MFCLKTDALLALAAATLSMLAASAALAQQSAPAHRSVKEWVKCDGTADDSAGLARAFAAASHSKFTLIIDCPVRDPVGSDITRSIFIDDGTSVEFAPPGKLTVDNLFIPAFVIANSRNITLADWNIVYDASMPVDHAAEGHASGAFNDKRLTPWLAANRRVVFDGAQGHATSFWPGLTNMCAVFYFTGDAADIAVRGMHVTVPGGAGVERFVPVVFSFNPNVKSDQTVTKATPYTAQYFALPHGLKFADIHLDGTYMGFVGSAQNATFDSIVSQRYGDLQDAAAGNVGGVGKWFAPPHLFYFSYSPNVDPALFNRNIQIRNVDDQGIRVGIARDRGGSDPGSGNALSLKIGCDDCLVDHYKTRRPDGFLDVLASNGLTISNVDATYDSAFLNNIYPGWRFPKPPYQNIRFENIVMQDVAPTTVHLPIENAADRNNQRLHFKNVNIRINAWGGPGALPVGAITGQDEDSSIDFAVAAETSRIKNVQTGTASLTLRASPGELRPGASTVLSWDAKNAQSCAAAGAWSGALPPSGTRSVSLSAAGTHDFTVQCGGDRANLQATVRVDVSR